MYTLIKFNHNGFKIKTVIWRYDVVVVVVVVDDNDVDDFNISSA